MWLERLDIRNVRNLAEVSLTLSPRLNIITGKNGSGKTSLLESIYLLSSGKSFRTHRFSNIPTRDSMLMAVYAKLSAASQRSIPLGLESRGRNNIFKADGLRLKKASELASYLPVVVIHQESQRVFTQSPKYRRAFLDWGVFHVERDFLSTWQSFNRSLKQRNAVLSQRGSSAAVDHWDIALSQSAMSIDLFRFKYLDKFIALFNKVAKQLLTLESDITVDYKRGWSAADDYLAVLRSAFEKDKIMGYTRKGPHRADIVFKVNGAPLHEYVSRGQQKLLVCSLYIAQSKLYSELTGKHSIFLIDDICAELDSQHTSNLMGLLNELETQVFVTTPQAALLENGLFPQTKMFHVERGRVSEVL